MEVKLNEAELDALALRVLTRMRSLNDETQKPETLGNVPTRIAIAGFPGVGKTTLAEELARCTGLPLLHCDQVNSVEWSRQSELISMWFDTPSFIIEGMTVPRALRKWLRRNPVGKPCDVLYWIEPSGELGGGQMAMGKGADTVLREILPELAARGVDFRGDRLATCGRLAARRR